jgi:hypothetical protein
LNAFFFARCQQRVSSSGNLARKIIQNIVHLIRIGARQQRSFLGPAQLSGRNHLHRLGDLLRVTDRNDPLTDDL